MTELRGGLFVADDAIRLACDLEARGFALTAKDSRLLVSNGSALTAADREGIVRLKRHLLAIIEYCGLRNSDIMPQCLERNISAQSAEPNSNDTLRRLTASEPIARRLASEQPNATAPRSSVPGAMRHSIGDSESKTSASESISSAHARAIQNTASQDERRIRRKAPGTSTESSPNLF